MKKFTHSGILLRLFALSWDGSEMPQVQDENTIAQTSTPQDMWMKYRDYIFAACMYLSPNGQKERMLAVFAAGGPRSSFAQ